MNYSKIVRDAVTSVRLVLRVSRMSKNFKEYLPWFSPDESVEACELLEEIKTVLEQMSAYGPLRKELRLLLSDKARACAEFLGRANRPQIERAVILALDALAETNKKKTSVLLSEAIEGFISKINRRAQ